MKFIQFSLLLLAGTLFFGSCLKKEFDAPPSTAYYDPALPVNSSIKYLDSVILNKAFNWYRVMGDTTISGVIVANDKSGNFYKQFVIQDENKRGISIVVDQSFLAADYPVGRKVYVKLKGLYIMNYKGMPEIVYTADSTGATGGIPSGLADDYIIKASYPNPVVPVEATLVDLFLNPNLYIGSLVKLQDIQFTASSSNVPYALGSNIASGTSRNIEDCAHNVTMAMYNSAYSSFQPLLTPTGNGTLYGIFSRHYSTNQILIRDTADVQFTKTRCP